MERDDNIDIIRGILIVLVVLGHYGEGLLHDVIFLFHMPVFLILSGYLFKRDKLLDSEYIPVSYTHLAAEENTFTW